MALRLDGLYTPAASPPILPKYLQAEGESPRPPASSRCPGRPALALPTSPRSNAASGKVLESLRHTSSRGLRGGQYDGAANGGAEPPSLPPLSLVPDRLGLVEGRVVEHHHDRLPRPLCFPRQRLQVGHDLPARKTLDRYEDVGERVAAGIRLVDDLGLEPAAVSRCRRSTSRTLTWSP